MTAVRALTRIVRGRVPPARVLAVSAGVGAVLAAGSPGVADADPGIADIDIDRFVRTVRTAPSVRDIDLARFVEPLESEVTSGRQVTVRISADVLFDFDEATLTDAARRRIAQLAPRLRGTTGTIEVSGHSDSVGDAAYNQKLSARRAEAVKDELARALGGDSASRIRARGFGETKPVAPNEKNGEDDPEGRAKNRRVEISFEKS